MNGEHKQHKMHFIRVYDNYNGDIGEHDVCCLNCKYSTYSLKLHKWYCNKTRYIVMAETVCGHFRRMRYSIDDIKPVAETQLNNEVIYK